MGLPPLRLQQVKVEIDRTIRLSLGLVITGAERVDVSAIAETVDRDSNTLGQTVTEQQIIDLPLNGRNFTQLGLLQAGVVPLTNGLVSAGGSIKATQAFAVNGQRPESNNYLLDGVRNVNRMDGGFAIRTPIDAIQEFRILTHTAPPEYGSNSGASVSVITRSGGNSLHGTVYYFGRNDAVDARNFFSADVEPLKQHQYGATLGGPIRRNKLFFFGFYEGFRNRQGVTKTATVPTPAERAGRLLRAAGSEHGQPADQLSDRAAVPRQPHSAARRSTRCRSASSTSIRWATSLPRCSAPPRCCRNDSTRAAFGSMRSPRRTGPVRHPLCDVVRIELQPAFDPRRRRAGVSHRR